MSDTILQASEQDHLATLAESIRKHLKAGAGAAADLLHHALAAGDALILAKAKAGHGGWLKFLRECDRDLSEDRAERYMRLARGRAEVNSACVRNLSLNAALRLLKSQSQKKKQRLRSEVEEVKAAWKPKKVASDDERYIYCSFCGKDQDHVSTLIAGKKAFICNECVDACVDLIKEHKNKKTAEQTAAIGGAP